MFTMSDTPRVIRIKSREQFNWLIDHLVTETHRAWDHWRIWGAIDDAIGSYCDEINQTPQFWELTRRAHKDSVVLRLGRLFDPHPTALSLCSLLQTVGHAVKTPALQYLGLDPSTLDAATLQVELGTVVRSDPLVSRLIELRNEYLAHRASRLVSSGSFSTLPRLDREALETLLNRAFLIAEKYSHLCGRPLLARWYPGADDYKDMLNLLRLGLQSRRVEGVKKDQVQK
jgi:AbiU2